MDNFKKQLSIDFGAIVENQKCLKKMPEVEIDEQNAGSLNRQADVCAVISRAIRESGKSRETIVGNMSYLTGETITVSMLDGFTATTRKNRFPAEWIPAFCMATNNYEFLELLVDPSPLELIEADQADLLDLGNLLIAEKEVLKRKKKILKRRG